MRAADADRPRGLFPWTLGLLAVGGLVPMLLYTGDAGALGAGALAAAAAFFSGAVIGFVFAIPRSRDGDADGSGDPRGPSGSPSASYRANTNLEQISDWLTKILVGVGLTQFRALSTAASDAATALGPSLSSDASADEVALALLVLYSVVGFLFAYLWTRLYLPELFQIAERKAEAVLHRRLRDDRQARLERGLAPDTRLADETPNAAPPLHHAPPTTAGEVPDPAHAATGGTNP